MLWVGLALTAALAVPTLTVAGLLAGGRGVLGGAAGLVLVALFFGASKVVLAVVARRSTRMLLPAAMGTYLVKIVLLGVCLVVVGGQGVFDRLAFAWSIVVGVVGWVAAELWVAVRTREPFYDPQEFRARSRERPRRPAATR